MFKGTKEQLAKLLKLAAEAHHAYEQATGTEDEHWEEWYAQWMIAHSYGLYI